MYGVCNDKIPGKTQYCSVSEPPKTLSDPKVLTVLESFCPEYVDNSKATTCCDAQQISVLKDSFQAVEIIIGKCPACYRNFLRLFCAMTCDPYQASFVTPTEIDNSTKAVSKLNYNFTSHFAHTFYQSIKDVTYMGGKALAILCDSNDCTEEKLFESLGDGNARAPFGINFVQSNQSFAMNHTVFRCNETVPFEGESNVGGPPCACADCSDSCFVPPIPPKPSKKLIFGIDIYYFAFGIVYIVFLVAFIGFQFGHAYFEFLKRQRESEQLIPPSPDQGASSEYSRDEIEAIKKRIGFQSRLSAIIEKTLSNCFGYLALGVASWPITTLVISSLVVLVLCSGLARFQITTDPVKLWSDSLSQAHQEKNFFDTNFA
ncbi:NPC intracellular cholesterol transporter 1 [Cichlidogyrus casuarinus]|uniref:NPC intracellular cholesterol transporter 1 n=1 Tax=Cichlidogyrus casuarinus TaxID=1844966 RepID=A0ABD2QG37_9PLAT